MENPLSTPRIAALMVAVLAIYAALWPMVAPDYVLFLTPWLDAIQGSEGLAIFGTAFTNYTGGYVTFLWAWSLLSDVLSDHAIIKLAGISGTVLCAAGVFACFAAAGLSRRRQITGTIVACALPSVALNGAGLAQADAFYTGISLLALAALIRGNRIGAGLVLCVALSFKLQAIFVAPIFAGLMLRDWRAVLVSALALVPIYLIVNGLYLAGGRSIVDVLSIYAEQSGTYRQVWMTAANIWLVPHMAMSDAALAAQYSVMVLIGLAIGALAAIAFFVGSFRAVPQTPDAILRWSAACALALPFLLPKMHDRYFFMAEVLLFVLAWVNPIFWRAALLSQISAVFVYCVYFDTLGLKALLGFWTVAVLSFVFMVATIAAFAQAWRQNETRPGPEEPEARTLEQVALT